ncbi:hypothetical protein ACH47X_14390 [Promicromonospora kroppenstedtii]|uniref:Uncharacterized protein n=1 Tax=Promicromonospora kroppenstedtii TaxID=440482 RepID=A0ABW7XKP9_9MICO
MPDEVVGPLFIFGGIVLGGLVVQWIFRRRAAKRAGSGTVEIVVWARAGRVPGLARKKKWIKAKATADEAGRLVWVKPAGEAVALTLRSQESRPRDKSDLWFLDPGTPVWDATTSDGQELGIVIPQAREHWFVEKLPVDGLSLTKP